MPEAEPNQTSAHHDEQMIELTESSHSIIPLRDHVTLQLPADSSHVTGSSCVRQRTVVDYAWENRHYAGRIVAAHGDYLAYAIASPGDRDSAVVRILARAGQRRALLRGLGGAVMDLSFASCTGDILLAVADSSGTLSVATIVVEAATDKLTVALCLRLVYKRVDAQCLAEIERSRALWCPYVPDDTWSDSAGADGSGGGEEACRLLLWSHGCTAELVNVATLLEDEYDERCVSECRLVSELEEGVARIESLPEAIVATCFSPDGSALAVACADGVVRFYQTEQADSDGVLLVLHQWRPHTADKPLSALYFLDDHQIEPEDHQQERRQPRQFWRAALTAARDGSELRVWSCHDWKCRQTITLLQAQPPLPLPEHPDQQQLPSISQWTAHVDPASRYVLLSDRKGRRLVLLDIVEEVVDGVSVMRLTSPRCLLLMHPILSLFVCSSSDIELNDGSDGDGHGVGCDDAVVTGRQIVCYTVQPRSLQETTLILEPTVRDYTPADDSASSSRNVSSSRSDESPTAFSQLPPAMNLLTPDAFLSVSDSHASVNTPETHNDPKCDLRSAINSNGSSPSIEVHEIMQADSASTSTVTATCVDKARGVFPAPPQIPSPPLPLPVDAPSCRCVSRDEIECTVRSAVCGQLTTAAIDTAISNTFDERVQSAIQKAETRLERLTVESVTDLDQRLSRVIDNRLSSVLTQAVSSTVAQSVSTSVAQVVSRELQQQCRELFSSSLLPAYEQSCRQLLTQLGTTFSTGVNELMQRLDDCPAAKKLQQTSDLLADTVHREVEARQRFETRVNLLCEEMRRFSSLVQQRAETPAPPGPQPDSQQQQERVKKLVASGRDSAALQLALSATDLHLLMFTCKLLPPSRVFSQQQQQQLSQPVVLSLVQQLSAEMTSDTHLKLEYLREALLCLEPTDVAVRDHLIEVLTPLARKLNHLLAENPAHKLTRNVRMICSSLLPRS